LKKGVTLIEVLVASLLLVITVGAVFFSMVASKKMIQQSTCESNANNIIKNYFESIRDNHDLAALCADDGAIGMRLGLENADEITVDGIIYKLYFETSSVNLTASSPAASELLELKATVGWTIHNNAKSISLSMRSNN